MGGDEPRRRSQVGARSLNVGSLSIESTRAETPSADPPRVVRVLPDEPAIDKTFDYLVPAELGDEVRVGTMVRIALHGRRVGGWVVEDGVEPPSGVELKPIAKVTGWGPAPDLLGMAWWAAWRWAGRPASLLRTASPPRAVRTLAAPRRRLSPLPEPGEPLARAAFDCGPDDRGCTVLRLPPAADTYDVALAAAERGNALILAPSVAGARHLGIRLRRAGVEVALHPDDWATARSGATVVGARAAAWAPVADLAAVLVLDEHDEVYQEERTPTWHARDVAVERARRADVPAVLVSPMPTLEAMHVARLLTASRSQERAGWPVLQVVDRRRDDMGRLGLYSEALVTQLRAADRAVCVLNRTGRSRLLACRSCGDLARCDACGSAVHQTDEGGLRCHRCAAERPVVCHECGSTAFKNLRVGVSRAREELEALLGEPVVEVTGETAEVGDARVVVGTEAALHKVTNAGLVAFLDFDQELLAPRYRAAEQALTLLVRAGRVVGPRSGGGRVLIQTRLPKNEVVLTALHADPGRLSDTETARREVLGLPPFCALAEVSGQAAQAFIDRLGSPLGVEVDGPLDDRWRLRAPDHATLADVLAAVDRPPGRLRIAIDPLRL